MSEPRKHHSVPQFLIRGFAKKKGKVWQTHVFDKRDDWVFVAPTEDIMAGRDFNALKTETGVISLEGYIAQIEDVAAPIVRRLVEAETASILSKSDRENISIFVALQLIRGTGHRAQYLDIARQFREVLIKRGMPADDPSFAIPDDGIIKAEALRQIVTAVPMYATHLHTKDMVIFKAAPDHDFILGDNPIAMDNHKEFGFKGNLGLAVEGVEIYLPLTSKLTLGLWANDLRPELREMITNVQSRKSELNARALLGLEPARTAARRALADLNQGIADAERLLKDVEAGGPVHTRPESMDRFNSMQVYYAERYLASLSGKFDLAKQMIVERPEISTGGARGRLS
jgi:uncharacterized protein DUF4238